MRFFLRILGIAGGFLTEFGIFLAAVATWDFVSVSLIEWRMEPWIPLAWFGGVARTIGIAGSCIFGGIAIYIIASMFLSSWRTRTWTPGIAKQDSGIEMNGVKVNDLTNSRD